MTEELAEPSPERIFLHDLCNAMAVSQGLIHLIMLKAKKDPPELKLDDMIARLEKVLASVDRMNKLVNDRRNVIADTILSTKVPKL